MSYDSYPTTPPPAGPPPGAGNVGFFGALFDFSFQHFVTPMVVKVVYVLGLIGLVLGYLTFLVAGFAENAAAGIAVLVLGGIGLIIYLAFFRMTLEFFLAVTRMSEDIHRRLPLG